MHAMPKSIAAEAAPAKVRVLAGKDFEQTLRREKGFHSSMQTWRDESLSLRERVPAGG
jgi:hypothetical protein